MRATVCVHSLGCTSSTSCDTSVVIHATDVASTAFQHVHCSDGLYRPLASLSRSFLIFHSQVRYLWEETLLCANIVRCLALVINQTHLTAVVETLILIFHRLGNLCGLLCWPCCSVVCRRHCGRSVDRPNSVNSDFQIFSKNHLILSSAVWMCTWNGAVVLLLWRLMGWLMCSAHCGMLAWWFSLATLILFLLLRVHFHILLSRRLCICQEHLESAAASRHWFPQTVILENFICCGSSHTTSELWLQPNAVWVGAFDLLTSNYCILCILLLRVNNIQHFVFVNIL